MPAFLQTARIALTGCICSVESGPATVALGPISASHSIPFASATALSITTTAAAPSEIGEAVPAVMVPSGRKLGRSLASDSRVVSARTPSSAVTTVSPRRLFTVTGTISSSNRPAA